MHGDESKRQAETMGEWECRFAPRFVTWNVGRPIAPMDGIADEVARFRPDWPATQQLSWIAEAPGMALRLDAVPDALPDAVPLKTAVDGMMGLDRPNERGIGRDWLIAATRPTIEAWAEKLESVAAGGEPQKKLAAVIRDALTAFQRVGWTWRFPNGRTMELTAGQPRIMGVVNVTPDSFSDGGRYATEDAAVEHALQLVADGADMVDVGGESTRPGSLPVSVEDECARVVPVISRLATAVTVPISIDSTKPDVVHRALDSGASIINDVSGFPPSTGLGRLAARVGTPVICMHMQGTPTTMQQQPHYADVVAEVVAFLRERTAGLVRDGVGRDQIMLDPGFGFGKTLAHNLEWLRRLGELQSLGQPILVGLSRKSMFASISGASVTDRLPETLAAHTLAGWFGASVLRVHDVREAKKTIAVVRALATGR